MALGLTQPLTEMSTRNISWGQGGRRVGLTTLPPSCAVVMKPGSLNLLEAYGPVQACNGIALPLLLSCIELSFFFLWTLVYGFAGRKRPRIIPFDT